jgi:quercetin dioxygenase-like cupin family protein
VAVQRRDLRQPRKSTWSWKGAVTVITNEQTITLGPLDSCLIEANEERIVENRSNDVAKMLVISPS